MVIIVFEEILILLCKDGIGSGGNLLTVSPDSVVVVELFADSVFCRDFWLGKCTCSGVCHLHILWEGKAQCAPVGDSHGG